MSTTHLGGRPTRDRTLRARGRQTVERLLTAGRGVLEQDGFAGMRVDDVVNAAGLSHGTFYLYFEDLDDLVRSLVREVAGELERRAESLPEPPVEQEALASWLDGTTRELARHLAVLRAARTLDDVDPNDGLRGPLTSWVSRHDPDVDAALVADLLLGAMTRSVLAGDLDVGADLARVLRRGALTPR